MGTIGCPETSVRNHRSTLRKIPLERRLQVHTLLPKKWQHDSSYVAKFFVVVGGLSVESEKTLTEKRQMGEVYFLTYVNTLFPTR
jgi:hypothetical protein